MVEEGSFSVLTEAFIIHLRDTIPAVKHWFPVLWPMKNELVFYCKIVVENCWPYVILKINKLNPIPLVEPKEA